MLRNWRNIKHTDKRTLDESETKKEKINLKINVESIKSIFKDCSDVKYKDLIVGDEKFVLVYIENSIDLQLIDNYILRPLLNGNMKSSNLDDLDVFSKIEKGMIPHISTDVVIDINKVVDHIINGNICLINTENNNKAIAFDVKKIEKRSITEPSNENIIKGSKESFIENVKVNVGLIRNRIKTPDLKVKEIKVGTEAQTTFEVIYLESVVDPQILEELLTRINNIKTKKLIAVADFEEQLIERKYSIFPQVVYTEKTDKFAANIVEGKIGILIDGIPMAYIVPALFNMFFQASEDYSTNYAVSTVLRILRYICMIITLSLPAFFVSISTFHQEMIPTELAISIIKSKQGEPFPTLVETVFMLLAFEILIEASARLPKTIGQTISIVGGLIIGQAAVTANLVSPAVVVVIAITGIAGFIMPNQDFANALRISRFLLLIASGILGLYGMGLGLIVIFYYIATLESFGIPYFVPFSGTDGRNILIDTLLRTPMKEMNEKAKKK